MKKIVLAVLSAVVVSSPLVAAENKSTLNEFEKEFRENNDILIRLGGNALGNESDVTGSGSTRKGTKHQMGFELSLGAEEKVENLELGTRRLMNFYSYGRTNYYDGDYSARMTNFGMETTGATYWKLTQYIKPYLGIGIGLNVNQFDDNNQYLSAQDFQLTLHGVGGISGELVAGLGYYAEYKYRLAPSQKIQATLQDGTTTAEIKNDSVNGGSFIAGISTQF